MEKAVLITGACINTGVAIVEKFAMNGWNVVFTGRNCETVHNKEAEYKKMSCASNPYGDGFASKRIVKPTPAKRGVITPKLRLAIPSGIC